MKLIERNYQGTMDLVAMAALVNKSASENVHVVDLPYRFCSWSFDYPENIRLWTDENGRILVWAVLLIPFWTIEYEYHPEAGPNLHQQILRWADEQAQKILHKPGGRSAWFVPVFANQVDRIRDLEQAGFASQADVGENSWSKVSMTHSMKFPNGVNLREGFQIRPLNGADEVDTYVELHRAVFESKNMTTEWRARTLQRAEYVPDLELVVIAPNGQLAAFCICWFAKDSNENISGQIEPLGVHANFRKLGLGKAILTKGLKRLGEKGAKHIYVQTDYYRNTAFKLYESAGFQVTQDILMFRKDYE